MEVERLQAQVVQLGTQRQVAEQQLIQTRQVNSQGVAGLIAAGVQHSNACAWRGTWLPLMPNSTPCCPSHHPHVGRHCCPSRVSVCMNDCVCARVCAGMHVVRLPSRSALPSTHCR